MNDIDLACAFEEMANDEKREHEALKWAEATFEGAWRDEGDIED